MVPHGAIEQSPTWKEVVGLGRELAGLDAVCGAQSQADVAILFDWESWWALELPSKPSNRVRQIDQLEAYYQPLFEANVTVDFVRPGGDLSKYRLLLVPNLYLVGDEAAADLVAFVEAGGTLVMSFFSGIVDPSDHIHLGGYPQPFRELLGVDVIDFHPLAVGQDIALTFADGTKASGDIWSENIDLRGAEVVATFASSQLAGRPAITSHRAGEGTAFYLGTQPDARAMTRVLELARTAANVGPTADVPGGVEAVRRSGRGKPFLFLLNHRDVAVDVRITEAGVNLLDGSSVHAGLLHLGPRGVAVIREGW
jgi:beta-galactosidase